MASAGRFVGHGDDPYDIIAFFHQSFEAFYGKIGGSHIYDTQIFFFHTYFLVLREMYQNTTVRVEYF
ncbi:unknown [Bacteroides sp. CAG:144]|nr:unknown [Bacteroides sp. CAG:144]